MTSTPTTPRPQAPLADSSEVRVLIRTGDGNAAQMASRRRLWAILLSEGEAPRPTPAPPPQSSTGDDGCNPEG
jgi:hypothetical protein